MHPRLAIELEEGIIAGRVANEIANACFHKTSYILEINFIYIMYGNLKKIELGRKKNQLWHPPRR